MAALRQPAYTSAGESTETRHGCRASAPILDHRRRWPRTRPLARAHAAPAQRDRPAVRAVAGTGAASLPGPLRPRAVPAGRTLAQPSRTAVLLRQPCTAAAAAPGFHA